MDHRIGRIAARQHGIITAQQLSVAGADPSAIKRRVAAGRLHRIHRAVYAVGHPSLGNEGRWMAAVLACGDDAVLSHRSAAELWGIDRARRLSKTGWRRGVVDVTVPSTNGRKHHVGIAIHRSRTLSADGSVRRLDIPVTTPQRTLADLRRTLPSRVYALMLREAEFLGLPTGEIGTDHSRSELEAKFLFLLRRHRLPKPEVNARIDRFVVDFVWHRQELIVELDGWKAHRGRSAFEADRARDVRLNGLGYRVLRFTWRQLEEDARGVVEAIRAMLSAC